MRPCLCGFGSDQAGGLCPVRAVWARIRDRVEAGAHLFPGLTASVFNRHLKATLAAMGAPEGGGFPHMDSGGARRMRSKIRGPPLRPYYALGTGCRHVTKITST